MFASKQGASAGGSAVLEIMKPVSVPLPLKRVLLVGQPVVWGEGSGSMADCPAGVLDPPGTCACCAQNPEGSDMLSLSLQVRVLSSELEG